MARKAAWIFGGVVAVIVVAGISGGGEDTTSDASKPSVEQSAEVKPSKKEAVKETPVEKSQTEQFKEFVNKNGTPAEKAAVKHVTKVQGADKFNDILDTASIYTDFKGDFVSDDAPTGKLLASAFADWKESDNGLVTVYNVKGEMLSNGNF
jgi:hypothetical protein